MSPDYPIDYEPATPEYVLEVFRDWHRFGLLEEEPTFDTSIRDLATNLNDTILFWRELARSLIAHLALDVPLAEWKPILHPMRRRTVRGVCEFVAARLGRRPVIRPWRHASGECLPAGAFLTARSLLARGGADPYTIGPGTPLGPYLRRSGASWVWDLARAAPGRIPPCMAHRPLQTAGCLTLGVGVAVGLLGVALRKCGLSEPALAVAGLGCFGLSIGGALTLAAMYCPPRRVTLGDLITFRDLAYALAGQEPRRRVQQIA